MTALGVARILPVPKLCVHLSLNNHLVNMLGIPDVLLSRAATTNYHKLWLKIDRNLLSHSSIGQKSEIKILSGLVLSGGSEEESGPCLSLGSW